MISDIDLSPEAAKAHLAEERRRAFNRLATAVGNFTKAIAEGKVVKTSRDGIWQYEQWEACETAYRALRALYVPFRSRGRARGGYDASLDSWMMYRDKFLNRFFGAVEADGKRRFAGVPDFVADVIKAYQKLQQKWHKKSEDYIVKKRKRDRDRARRLGLNTSQAGKASKKKYSKTKKCKASQAKYLASEKGQRAAERKRLRRKTKKAVAA
jgi:hypothetical protein